MTDDRLELVRKLLAMAEGTTNEAERDAFNVKAAALIAKYGIDQALLANAGQVRDEVGDKIITLEAPYLTDKATLLNRVASALRVRTVRRTSTRTSESMEVHLFGFAADLERVDILFTSLLVQASFGIAAARPPSAPGRQVGGDYGYWYQPRQESVAAYRRSWLYGFTVAVQDRLEAAEQRAKAEADAGRKTGQPGTDIVLASRDQQVATRVSEVYPRLKNGPKRTLRGSGFEAGKTAGKRADLGGTRIAGRGERGINK